MNTSSSTITPELKKQMVKHIILGEKSPEYPYLDSKGLVTGGAGFMVNSEEEFIALDFDYLDDEKGSRKASEAETPGRQRRR